MTEQGPEDVEGQMARREDAADDVEGHARHLQKDAEDDDDGDVEGHMPRRPL
jgi:hypothetical protein